MNLLIVKYGSNNEHCGKPFLKFVFMNEFIFKVNFLNNMAIYLKIL